MDGNTAFTVEYVTEVIGDRLNITLESLTEEIIEITDSQIVELKSLIEEFRMAMKEDFPKGKFLGYKLKKKDCHLIDIPHA